MSLRVTIFVTEKVWVQRRREREREKANVRCMSAELAILAVSDFYGEKAATIVSLLLQHGRLTLRQLKEHADLTLAQCKNTLVTLIQQSIVKHATDGEKVHYECSFEQAYLCLRYGQEIAQVQGLVSKEAASLTKYLLMYGRQTIGDLLHMFEKEPRSHQALAVLMEQNYVCPARLHEVVPPTDVENEIRAEERLKYSEVSALLPKHKKVIDATTEARLREMDTLPTNWSPKRKADSEVANGRKKPKSDFNNELLVRVNHDKFVLLALQEGLCQIVAQRMGYTASLVYSAFLSLLIRPAAKLNTELDKVRISTSAILESLSSDIDLSALYSSDSTEPIISTSPSRKRRIIEEDIASPPNRQRQVRDWLDVLARDTTSFLILQGSGQGGFWSADLTYLAQTLKTLTFSQLIEEQYGSIPRRLIKIVVDKRKVDEKQLAKVAMLRQKDVRIALMQLHSAGVVDMQEVPRTADRLPSRSFYLWYHDAKRAQDVVVRQFYAAIVKALQRLMAERRARMRLLQKVTLLQASSSHMPLTPSERTDWARLQHVEERLVLLIMRMDKLVLIFRDL